MNQIVKLLQSLSLRQRISIGLAVLAVGAGLSLLISSRRDAEFKPLYTGMASDDASVVAQKLRELGVDCRLDQNGTAVLVPSGRLAELRLRLAGEGLPKSGRMGFEIFDRTQFGTTDFAEHVNYRRALEGELERTIMSLSEVERARVHITFPKDSVFVDSRQPAKASVLVSLRGAAGLPPASVVSITHLVASAVEGLSPDAVSVVDRQGRLLSRARFNQGDEAGPSDAALDYRERIEKATLARLNEALEPVLGPARFRAGVSVDCDLSTVEESEETLDPSGSVTLTSQKTEETNEGASASGGIPGTASNLPQPPPRTKTPAGITRRSENSTFQTSRKVRHVRQPKGSIVRISVAVLVDHNVRWEQTGTKLARISEPPSAERLKAIHDIAAAVVGLDENRGDQITVEALPFESNANEEPPQAAGKAPPAAESSASGWAKRLMEQPKVVRYVEGGAFLSAFVTLMAVLLRRWRPSRVSVETQPQLKGSDAAAASKQLAGGEGRSKLEEQTLRALEAIARGDNGMDMMVVALRRAVEKDSSAAAGVLRGWMFEKNL